MAYVHLSRSVIYHLQHEFCANHCSCRDGTPDLRFVVAGDSSSSETRGGLKVPGRRSVLLGNRLACSARGHRRARSCWRQRSVPRACGAIRVGRMAFGLGLQGGGVGNVESESRSDPLHGVGQYALHVAVAKCRLAYVARPEIEETSVTPFPAAA